MAGMKRDMYNPDEDGAPRCLFFPVEVPATSTSVPLAQAGDVRLGGWSWRETTGIAPADLTIVDGNASTGTKIADVTLQPGQTIRDPAPGGGIVARVGVFIVVNSGTVSGSVWVGDL